MMTDVKRAKMDTGGLAEFQYSTEDFNVTPEMKQAFDWDGAIMVRNLLSPEEIKRLTQSLETDSSILKHAFDIADGTGTKSRLSLWNHPGNDITGMVARARKVAGTCQELLGGEVYHYHTKLMMKEPRTGGKHLWHQDYGYWYKNGCLRPDMMTVFISLDRCVKANGCLQVLKGTQRCGRIEHVLAHGQTRADQDRVDELAKHFQHLHVEMEPGDALFFHCNLLHTSDKNLSDLRRWAFLIAYNRADNDPVYQHHHPQYTPLDILPDSAILDCKNLTDVSGKDFMDVTKDKTISAKLVETSYH